MNKHCLLWKPIRARNVRGADYWNEMPDLIAAAYRGTLLSRILAMPRGNPISFELAVSMTTKKFFSACDERRFGYGPGECHWYHKNFVEWISSQGHHIEITGDEFEAVAMTDRLA